MRLNKVNVSSLKLNRQGSLSPSVIEIPIRAWSGRAHRDMKPRLNEISLTLLYLNNKLSMSYLNLFMPKMAFFNISCV